MALELKATVNYNTFLDDAEEYFDDIAPEVWRRIFRPLINGIILAQGKRWAATLGITFDVQNLYARDWLNAYLIKFAQDIIQNTKDYVVKTINQGITEGWAIPTMQNHLTDLFGRMAQNDPANLEWYTDRLPPYRTEMIARTETIRASNAGTTELFKEWGVRRHEWLSTKDDRTRTQDEDAKNPSEWEHLRDWPDGPNGEVRGIDEPFLGTGEPLMYPGDPAGDPGNTINCRCTVIPIVEGME